MPSIWLLALQAAVSSSPSAQAEWAGETPPIEIRLRAPTLSMRGEAPIEVDLIGRGGSFAVSPFLQLTRGIAFEVMSDTGQPVAPAKPMAGSPPSPPLAKEDLITVSTKAPYRILTHESARTIFPRAGRFRVRARLYVFSFASKPIRYAQVVSETITVKVTE
ncbi:hypothetical protein [Sphingomonas sp. BK580]|uniref:hypothetical protein n=1 Tax=Sphingomonas sp. BK580 TaxID=2586972 RepID=UPI001616B113|nr:hypothetical protein [Sphingomonas sp. BK580]MBB3694997.1 hypothetical protein [Sphingomonas sp. BK580]